MYKSSFAFLCIVLLCGPAQAANNDSTTASEKDIAANKAADADYLGRFQKNYQTLKTTDAVQPSANQPPFDIIAAAHAGTVEAAAFADCENRRSELKTAVARMQCRLDAAKVFSVAEKLRDMEVYNAYAATVLDLATDFDAGKIAPQQVTSVDIVLGDAYRSALGTQYVFYLASFIKQPVGADAPPYDKSLIGPAEVAAEAARKLCETSAGLKSAAEFTNCIVRSGKNFNGAIKLQDLELADYYEGMLRQAAADADAGRLMHPELVAASQSLAKIYSVAISLYYLEYEKQHFSALFRKLYTDAKSRRTGYREGPEYYDLAAYRSSRFAFDLALNQCGQNAAGATNRSALMACYIAANKDHASTIKMDDPELFQTYARLATQVGKDADAGALTPDEAAGAYEGVLDAYDALFNEEASVHEAAHPHPAVVAAYLATYDTKYAALKARSAKASAANAAPLYDQAVFAAAEADLNKSFLACNNRYDMFEKNAAKHRECVVPAYDRFMQVIKFRDDDRFSVFLSLLLQTAQDMDDGKIAFQVADAVDDALWQRLFLPDPVKSAAPTAPR